MTDERAPGPGGTPAETLFNIARGAKAAALLLFFLPWMAVSCEGTKIMSATGAGMATGNVRVTMPNIPGLPDIGGQIANSARPDLLIAAAAVLILLGLAATFLLRRRRQAALVGMVTSLVAAVLIGYEVLVRIKGLLQEQLGEVRGAVPAAGNPLDGMVGQQIERTAQAMTVDPQIGFWLTLIALVAAAVLFKIVHGRPDRAGAP
jgi:hypothetical protein